MRSIFRRRFFVRPFQFRLVLFQALYFAAITLSLYLCLVAPLLAAVQDTDLSLESRFTSAEALILFDRRVLPYFVPLVLVLFAHSVLISHRIAGPLYRFAAVLRSVKSGDLSMRFRIRSRDYLQEEARLLDDVVADLRDRLASIRRDVDTIEHALPGASEEDRESTRAALARLNQTLDGFQLEERAGSRQVEEAGGMERLAGEAG